MYPFRKREKRPTPPWLKWAAIGFLAFAAISRPHNGDPNSTSALGDALHKSAQVLDPKKLVPLENYHIKVLPQRLSPLRFKDIAKGTGAPVICGQEVTASYDAFLLDDTPIEGSEVKNTTFRIGEHKAMPALEQGILSMQKGGKRSLLAPWDMSYGIREFSNPHVPDKNDARIEVQLLSVSPEVPDVAATPFRAVDAQEGSGIAISCGDSVKANVVVWSVDGKKLYESKEPVSFTVGKSEVFLGLDQGLLGLKTGGTRTLVVPPSLQKTMNGNPAMTDMHLPPHQTVLVDVQSLP